MKKFAARAALAAVAIVMSGAASAATVNTLVFNGVTWTTTSVDADTVTIRIENALDALGNWGNITHLWTLGVDPVGTVTDATITPGSATFSGKELNANGCAGGLSGKACFTFDPFYVLTNDMTFTVDFVGSDLDMEGIFHIKVGFLCSPTGTSATKDTKACGSLMSRDIFTSSSGSTGSTGSTGEIVTEPGTMALLGLGLVGLGFVRRRKATV